MEEKKNNKLLYILNELENDIGAVIMIVITILLTLQVISRYVFGKSFTWAEELSTIMFVWSIYLGIAASILKRKTIRIDAFVNLFPFKAKKVILIFEDLCTIVFCAVMVKPIIGVIQNLHKRSAVTALMRLPVWLTYIIIPICLVLTVIRLVQDIFKLAKEDEQTLGKGKATLDIAKYEKEWEQKRDHMVTKKEGGVEQ